MGVWLKKRLILTAEGGVEEKWSEPVSEGWRVGDAHSWMFFLESAERTTPREAGNYGMYKESQEGCCGWFLEVDLREL